MPPTRHEVPPYLLPAAPARLPGTPTMEVPAAQLERLRVAVERARLSEHVYQLRASPQVPEPAGWQLLTPRELAALGVSPAMLFDATIDFQAALYQGSFEHPARVVIAYAGTTSLSKGAFGDVWQGLGLKTTQSKYKKAMELAKAVARRKPAHLVETTGHSLGGTLAAAATVVTGARGYTFNAAGLHAHTVGRYPFCFSRQYMLAQAHLIDAYYSTADPLTLIQNGLNFPHGYLGPKALGTAWPVAPAPQLVHHWHELLTRHPLAAAKAMFADGHEVPQLVTSLTYAIAQASAGHPASSG